MRRSDWRPVYGTVVRSKDCGMGIMIGGMFTRRLLTLVDKNESAVACLRLDQNKLLSPPPSTCCSSSIDRELGANNHRPGNRCHTHADHGPPTHQLRPHRTGDKAPPPFLPRNHRRGHAIRRFVERRPLSRLLQIRGNAVPRRPQLDPPSHVQQHSPSLLRRRVADLTDSVCPFLSLAPCSAPADRQDPWSESQHALDHSLLSDSLRHRCLGHAGELDAPCLGL